MTSTATDYLRSNVPRGKVYVQLLNTWATTATPEITYGIPAGYVFYLEKLHISIT